MISVYIPVGPYPVYKKYLPECVESVRQQTVKAAEIILIDDMADIDQDEYPDCRIWRSPWRLGIPAVNNCGVALAKTDLVLYCGCDDLLMPNCLEMCAQSWEIHNHNKLGYYWLDIQYSTGETQALPTGHAMVHKALWKHTGGYPPESAVGACDHIWINWALQHKHDVHLYEVSGGPLSWHREHDDQYTKRHGDSYGSITNVREAFNRLWQPDPVWGRYTP